MRVLCLALGSVFLLAGCASLVGDENDSAACEQLALAVSGTNVGVDINPSAIAATLRAEVEPLAGSGLAARVAALATALEAVEVDAAAAGAAASEIGVRCALTGVMFDFTGIGQFLN